MILDMPHFPLNPEQKRLNQFSDSINSANLKVRAHGRFWDLNPVSLYPKMRQLTLEQTIESIDACDEINGEIVTIHPGRCWFRGDKELFQKSKNWFQDYLKKTSNHAKEKGIKIAIETGSHNADYPKNPTELLESVKPFEEVGITLDAGHLFLAAKERNKSEKWIADIVEMVKDELINVHLHDNQGISDDHLPPGRGKIKFNKIIQALEKHYDGPLILEMWELSDPLGAVNESIQYLENLT